MNVITHALVGWSLVNSVPGLSQRERLWVVAAACAPDLDGIGLVAELATRNSAAPLFWWSEYHHLIAHNLAFAVVLSCIAWAHTRRSVVGLLVLVSVHLHLLGDLVGSRGPDGYQWPLVYLWPFSESPRLAVSWQWQLNAWPNVVISLVLLAHLLWLAWKRGTSPLEFFSRRANSAFVAALRARFSTPRQVS